MVNSIIQNRKGNNKMKISYIILPFESSEYLIRCVNSLYRQIGSDYKVIIAENDFGEDSDELNQFLDEKRQLIRISQNAESRKEKLAEAVKLIPDDSTYVMLVDVNTVVAPIAAQAILSCEKSDMIIPVAAVRDGNEFRLDDSDEISFIEKIERHTPDRICFSRKLFTEFYTEILLADDKPLHHWILENFSENLDIDCTKDVCMYMSDISEKKADKIDIGQWKTVMSKIANNFENIGNMKLKLGIVNKFTADFLQIMDGNIENAASIYTEFQNLCGKCMDSPLLNKLVEQRVGFQSEDFLRLDLDEYRLFLNLAHGKDGIFLSAEHPVIHGRRLSQTEENLEKLKREVASIRTEQGVNAATPFGQIIADPVRDVPRMYREGRLGFRTIVRSLMGWLGYKLGRKK